MGIIHLFFPLQSFYSRLKKHQSGDEHDCEQTLHLSGRTLKSLIPFLQKQASLFLYSGLCVFVFFRGCGAALLLQLWFPLDQGGRKICCPESTPNQRTDDTKRRGEKQKREFEGKIRAAVQNGIGRQGEPVDQQASKVFHGLNLTHVESLR